jgi:hypothetical protein
LSLATRGSDSNDFLFGVSGPGPWRDGGVCRWVSERSPPPFFGHLTREVMVIGYGGLGGSARSTDETAETDTAAQALGFPCLRLRRERVLATRRTQPAATRGLWRGTAREKLHLFGLTAGRRR